MNTEENPASRSVLLESELKEIISIRSGAAAWKEAESKLEQLTAQFNRSSKGAI